MRSHSPTSFARGDVCLSIDTERGSRGTRGPHGALGGLRRVLSGVTQWPGASAELRRRPRGAGPSAGLHTPGRDPADHHPGPSKHPVTAGASGSWPRAPSCLPSRILHLDPRSLLHCELRKLCDLPSPGASGRMDLDRGRLRAAGEVAATDSEVSEPCPGLLCLGEAPSLPNPRLLCMK